MRFRAEAIRRIVEEEIASSWEEMSTPWQGIAPERILEHVVLPPRSERFAGTDPGRIGLVRLWVVFDERPGSADGYLIVYDPQAALFGLATKPRGRTRGRFLGYGAACFLVALQSM